MPHKYIGPDDFYYVRQIGSTTVLNNGDWIPPADIVYFETNHPDWVELIGADDTPETETDFIPSLVTNIIPELINIPEHPPVGYYKLYVRHGVLKMLDCDGIEVSIQTSP